MRVPVPVVVPNNNQVEKLVYELSDPPAGVELKETVPGPNGVELVLVCDPAKAKAGESGNLIVAISGERKVAADAQPQPNRQRIPLGSLPAMPFEIVAK